MSQPASAERAGGRRPAAVILMLVNLTSVDQTNGTWKCRKALLQKRLRLVLNGLM